MKHCLLLLFAAAILLMSADRALGCDCTGPPPDVALAFDQAKAVFSGRVIGRRKGRVILRVKRAWKGVRAGQVLVMKGVVMNPNGVTEFNDCDFIFNLGRRYLVYAGGKTDALGTDICTRTKGIKAVKRDIEELERLRRAGRMPARRGKTERQGAKSNNGMHPTPN